VPRRPRRHGTLVGAVILVVLAVAAAVVTYALRARSTAIGLIAHGLGIGALPSSVASMVEQAGLARARVHGPVVKRQIGIITRSGRSLSPAAQALVAQLRSAARAP